MTPPLWQKMKGTKKPLDESERGESEKVGLKLIIQKTKIMASGPISSLQFSCSVLSDSLWPHEPQHARPPCPSPTAKVYANPCPLSQWCHAIISSSVVPFSSCPQSFPASGSFQISQLFTSGGQSIGVSASWQIDGETVADFIFWALKITADGDCSHEIKRRLLLGRKVMTNIGSILKKQRHYFVNKGPSSQGYSFSSSHIGMLELDYKESWAPKNWCF